MVAFYRLCKLSVGGWLKINDKPFVRNDAKFKRTIFSIGKEKHSNWEKWLTINR